MPVEVPANVAEAICRRWPDRGRAWKAAVSDELANLCVRYAARPIGVMRGRYGFVVAVETALGPLVFRGSPDPEAQTQAQVAGMLADLGVAPTLHEVKETATGVWTVMDRVTPGTPLADLRPSDETRPMLASMLRLIVHGQQRPVPDLPTIAGWLRSRLLDDELDDLAPSRTVAPKGLRKEALSLVDEIGENVRGVCHGDASRSNILQSKAGHFMLVDPRGLVGDPAYDVAVVAMKSTGHLHSSESAKFFADVLELDVDRVASWMVVAEAARV